MNMKKHLYPITLALLPVLVGCVPGLAEYSKSEAPARVRVDGATDEVALAFAPGSARIGPREDARLDRLVANGAIVPADRVDIAASGSPALAAARSAAISSRLLRWGVVADARPLAGVPRDYALVTIGRYAVTLPPCPNWSMQPASDFSNAPTSNFGCANAVNLGLMVASPGDLVASRSLGPADGKPAAAAVDRYLNDQVQLPALITLGPIGSAPSAPPAAAAPAGAGGQ